MNISMVLQHKLLLGIQRLMPGAPASAAKAAYWPNKPALSTKTHDTPVAGLIEVHPATVVGLNSKKIMPLRVLRVVEKGQPRSSTGRLVISGRMADVCAELDRLVARDAALH